jgi:L-fuconolactonase
VIVDSHCHALPHWFEPVEALLHQMDANGVDKATLVQVRGQLDNDYLFECMRRFPGRLYAVVGVDTTLRDAPDLLAHAVDEGAVGVRLDATSRSPGRDPLAVWRRAAELGVPVSVFGSADEFAAPAFEHLLAELPNLRVVIEHLGRIGRHRGSPMPTFHRILALARHSNAYVKIHGLGELCPRPMPFPAPMRLENVPPFVELALDAFGAERVMWGSDFPPVSAREGYRNALRWPLEHLASRGEAERERIFGGTALSLFSCP